jgi:hypothetical protein
LQIVNCLGEEVAEPVHALQSPGAHTCVWEGKDRLGRPVPSGIYFCRIKIGAYTENRKMLLLK